jgi:hypothetical protein
VIDAVLEGRSGFRDVVQLQHLARVVAKAVGRRDSKNKISS